MKNLLVGVYLLKESIYQLEKTKIISQLILIFQYVLTAI